MWSTDITNFDNYLKITTPSNIKKLLWSMLLCFLLVWIALNLGNGTIYNGISIGRLIDPTGYEKAIVTSNNRKEIFYIGETVIQMNLEFMSKNTQSVFVLSSIQVPCIFYMFGDIFLRQHQTDINPFQSVCFLDSVPQKITTMATTQLYQDTQVAPIIEVQLVSTTIRKSGMIKQ